MVTVTRQFVNEHAREIKITIEGPNSLSENTLTEMEARHLSDALNEALPPDEIRLPEDQRYFIGYDNSGHKYIVPVAHWEDWEEWLKIPEDDERSWDEPGYATRFSGCLTFTYPIIS